MVNDINDVDFVLEFQDYWLCRKKQKLATLAIKITHKDDINKGALIIDKAYDFAKLDLDKEIEKLVVKTLETDSKTNQLTQSDLNDFPKVNDIPYFSKSQIGVSLGFSTGSLPLSVLEEKYDDYYNKLYLISVGADIDFYGSIDKYNRSTLGIGLKTEYSFADRSEQNVNMLDDENNIIGTGKLADDIKIFFLAPSIIYRLPFYSYNILSVIKLSPGYLNYKNNAVRFDESIKYKGNAFAFGFSIVGDFRISQKFNMGFEARMLFAGFNKMKINEIKTDLETKEKLNRFGLALVL